MPPPDEEAFRSRRADLVELACPFERALLSRCAACSRARSTLLAEREVIGCTSASASKRCRAYRSALREKALFALRVDASAPWPFGKEIRLQCGGLIGLREALVEIDGQVGETDGQAGETDGPVGETYGQVGETDAAVRGTDAPSGPTDPRVEDADTLMRAALARYRTLDALPFSLIMRSVTGYAPRRRVPR